MITVATVREEKIDYHSKYLKEENVLILDSREQLIDSAIYGLMEAIVKNTNIPEFRLTLH